MYTSKDCTPTIRKRIAVERHIVAKVVLALLKAGYEISVFDGEENFPYTADTKAIFSQLGNTDEDKIYVHNRKNTKPTNAEEDYYGWVYMIYGNDGYDVVNDYTTNLSHVIEDLVDGLYDQWQERASLQA